MTKVGRIFEEEKEEAIKEAQKKERIKIAKDLLGILSPELIAEKTGLDLDEIKQLQKD